MINTILFDLDGLLIDSESLYERFSIESAKELGFVITPQLYAHTLGYGNEMSRRFFSTHFGKDYPAQEVENRTYKKVYEYIGKNTAKVLKKGVLDILDTLDVLEFKTAVASSNDRNFVMFVLDKTGLADRFDAIVTAADVKKTKPAPDIFLKAAQLLNSKPEQCLVLEDSPNGIKAAQAAGMKVIMVPDLKQPDEDIKQKTHKILDSLKEVKDYIMEERLLTVQRMKADIAEKAAKKAEREEKKN